MWPEVGALPGGSAPEPVPQESLAVPDTGMGPAGQPDREAAGRRGLSQGSSLRLGVGGLVGRPWEGAGLAARALNWGQGREKLDSSLRHPGVHRKTQ